MFLRRLTTASPPLLTPAAAAGSGGKPSRPSAFNSLNQKLRDSLAKNMKLESVTSTQNDIMHVLFSGRNLIVKADRTLQKTLALGYMLPVLNKLVVSSPNTKFGCPRAIIIGPNSQFVAQTERLVKKIAPDFRCVTLTNNAPLADQGNRLCERPVDIVVTEPSRLAALVQRRMIRRDLLQIVVLHDLDSMYEKDFYELMYFYAKTDIKVRKACEIGLKEQRDVEASEVKQPKNTFQSVAIVEKLLLTRVHNDFGRYLEKPTTMLDYAEVKPDNKAATKSGDGVGSRKKKKGT